MRDEMRGRKQKQERHSSDHNAGLTLRQEKRIRNLDMGASGSREAPRLSGQGGKAPWNQCYHTGISHMEGPGLCRWPVRRLMWYQHDIMVDPEQHCWSLQPLKLLQPETLLVCSYGAILIHIFKGLLCASGTVLIF